ncbi:uncharacterized protein At4g14450, chloroplastic-like [Phalaenopsis equestris]|uniref:uncharacterized protein At4g14450, chloroplastic-like n=1 Tax=Phalaenopsis equestris TaxID=78828 RepID=UPI0009E257A1|nr:uncharacterized protein At4g14450, chloroplastic-like [Phalaenopsis equestris]
MSMAKSMEVAGDGKIGRNQSRLRMHAPSSIQVVPTSGSVAEWKVAIPLLSPLDIVSIPLTEDLRGNELAVKAGKEEEASSGGSEGRGVAGRWRHPAEPFYYEPAPAFTVPHCT